MHIYSCIHIQIHVHTHTHLRIRCGRKARSRTNEGNVAELSLRLSRKAEQWGVIAEAIRVAIGEFTFNALHVNSRPDTVCVPALHKFRFFCRPELLSLSSVELLHIGFIGLSSWVQVVRFSFHAVA